MYCVAKILGSIVKKFLLPIFLFVFGTHSFAEEVWNEDGVFAQVEVCSAYEDFLQGRETEAGDACHPIAEFLIENQSLGYLEFLEKISAGLGSENFLEMLASGLREVMFSNALLTFLWLDRADRWVFYTMKGTSRDEERAWLYSLLISDLKYRAIQSLCNPNADCNTLELFSSTKELLGSRYSWVDEARPDHILMCLIRTDAFLMPVRMVLDSPRFSTCISTLKGE